MPRSLVRSAVLIALFATTACSTGPDSSGPGDLAWRTTLEGAVFSAPAVSNAGTIVVATAAQRFYGVDAAGDIVWENFPEVDVYSSPVLAEDGTVYAGSSDWSMLSVTPTGIPNFVYEAEGQNASAPAIATDGALLYGQSDVGMGLGLGALYRLVGDYDLTAKLLVDYNPRFSAVIGSDGTIYILFGGGLYAHDGATRDQTWSFGADAMVTSRSPAIDDDGNLYFGAVDGLYAVTPVGALLWKYAFTAETVYSAVIGSDGTVYVASDDGSGSAHTSMRAIDSDGTLAWSREDGGMAAPPVLGADGTTYWPGLDGSMTAVGADGSSRWRFSLKRDTWASEAPALTDGGLLLMGTADGYLVAIITDSPGLADAPWPRFRGSNLADGRKR